MEIKIQDKKEQKLLSRTELSAHVTFDGTTPSREDIKKELTKKTKSKEELIIVKHIYTKFGSKEADLIAYVYQDKKVMAVLEKNIRKTKEKKEAPSPKPAEEKPAEEKPAEEKPTEAQPEEKKEEPKE